MSSIIRCTRCRRRYRGHGEWQMNVPGPFQVDKVLCPECMTREESAEAEINDASVRHWATQQITAYLNSRPPKNDA